MFVKIKAFVTNLTYSIYFTLKLKIHKFTSYLEEQVLIQWNEHSIKPQQKKSRRGGKNEEKRI